MAEINITKSPADNRLYRYFKLDNGIRCLAIEDPDADKCAASLDVDVGSCLDPKPLYGTAHFLEHMLFQGNEKYPDEKEYSEYMSNNGGYNNAYTSQTNTNYHFECSNEACEGGIDRLAQFFISPAFSKDSADREVNAVDSEFNMAKQNDGWHSQHLKSVLSHKDSYLNNFQCGNKISLEQEGMRDSLLAFHKKWYSSNIMTLAVQSKHSLDDQEKWIRERFSPVPNFNVTVPDLSNPPAYNADNLSQLYKFVPVNDEDQLTLYWWLPSYENEHTKKPMNYFSQMIGHEGENSLLSYLISEGLALELGAGGEDEIHSYTCFQVNITLTKKGLEQYEKVIEAVFQYVKMIASKDPSESFFKEIQDIGKMRFKFQEKGGPMSYVTGLSKLIQRYNDDNIVHMLRQRYETDEFDSQMIKNIANLMCNPECVNIEMKSKSFAEECTINETWFGTKYCISKLSDEVLNKMRNPNCEIKTKKLDLPPPNNLIPKNFDIHPKNEEQSKTPILLKQYEDTDVWYLKDDKFEKPKGNVNMKLFTNDCGFGSSLQARLFVNFWNEIQTEYLREFSYMASQATLNSSISVLHDNINFSWSGFNDSMPNYIIESLEKIFSMKEANLEAFFDQVKEKLKQEWTNAYLDQSYIQAIGDEFNYAMYPTTIEKKDLNQAQESYTYEQFMVQLNQWLKSGKSVWFFSGNIDPNRAISTVDNVRQKFNLQNVSVEDLIHVRSIAIENNTAHMVESPLTDKNNGNSCVVSVFESGLIRNNMNFAIKNAIMMQWLSTPFFDDLRTKQQLGYVVHARAVNTRDNLQCQFIVQSDKRSCEYIIHQLNEFLIDRRQAMKNLSDEDFETQKSSVNTQLAAKDKNMNEVTNRMWGFISTFSFHFTKQQDQLDMLKIVTKEELQAHFEKVFFSQESKRIDLCLTSENHKDDNTEYRAINNNHEMFKNMNRQIHSGTHGEFKKSMMLHPDNYKIDYEKFLKKKHDTFKQ